MTTKRRYFTVAEANAMLPVLDKTLRRLMQMRIRVQEVYKRLAPLGYAPKDDLFLIAPEGATQAVIDDLSSLKALLQEMKQQLEMLLESGCLIKDLESGLIDWYAKKDEHDILLC